MKIFIFSFTLSVITTLNAVVGAVLFDNRNTSTSTGLTQGRSFGATTSDERFSAQNFRLDSQSRVTGASIFVLRSGFSQDAIEDNIEYVFTEFADSALRTVPSSDISVIRSGFAQQIEIMDTGMDRIPFFVGQTPPDIFRIDFQFENPLLLDGSTDYQLALNLNDLQLEYFWAASLEAEGQSWIGTEGARPGDPDFIEFSPTFLNEGVVTSVTLSLVLEGEVIPEPSTGILVLVGGLALLNRRSRQSK